LNSTAAFEVLDDLAIHTRGLLETICDMEFHRPFTVNEQDYFQYRKKFKDTLSSQRQKIFEKLRGRPEVQPDEEHQEVRTGHQAQQYEMGNPSTDVSRLPTGKRESPPEIPGPYRLATPPVTPERNGTQINTNAGDPSVLSGHEEIDEINEVEDLDRELGVMSEVLAHFEIALRRITDYVPMFIEYCFMKKFSSELNTELISKLALTGKRGEGNCRELTEENVTEREKRKTLMAKRDALAKTLRKWKEIDMEQ